MKKILLFAFLIITLFVNAQEDPVVQWLNTNAITIEDATQNTALTAFGKNTPQKFKDARIFGFGEATHNTKEFFDLKAKFFKYLVEKQGINIFIIEDGYITSYMVNEWLSGKSESTARQAAGSLGFAIWRTEEVANLLQWMKDYNSDKPRDKQIRFYGMDDQFGYGINTLVREYIKESDVAVPETLLVVADSCANKRMMPAPKKEWSAENVAKLKELHEVLAKPIESKDKIKQDQILHALDVLIQYTNFIANPSQRLRDNDMFDNVKWIVEHEGANSKAFIWAHNSHVNKKALSASNVPSVGSRLKEFYKDDYYSVGFDFGKGQMYGIVKQDKGSQAMEHSLKDPYKGTYAKVFTKVQPAIFFIDAVDALKDEGMAKFLGSNKKQLSAGGGGYNPKYPYLKKIKYSEAFDGLIFVKTVSIPIYIKESLHESFLIK